MPLYEVLIEAKQAVVLDLGAAYTKFGFTGEAAPRCIIPSQFMCPRTKCNKRLFDYNTQEELYDNLVEMLHILYFKHVLVNPKDRKVVVVESLLTPTSFRETLAKVLFLHYEVSSVVFAWWGACVSACAGADVCLCVDLGYNETRVECAAHGVAIMKAIKAEPFGAVALHQAIREQLLKDNPEITNLSDEIVEDIKVKTCFVSPLIRAQQMVSGTLSGPDPPAVSYPLQGCGIIQISPVVREFSAECWFPRDHEHNAISDLILQAIMQCPLDLRKELAQNIVITGGAAMLPGIKNRISQELKHLITTPQYKDKIYINDFSFHMLPCCDNYSGWLGGAMLGATDAISTRALSREQYCKENRLKDWVNLLDNTHTSHPYWEGLSL